MNWFFSYEVTKQKFAVALGFVIVVFHIVFSFYLWSFFNPNFNSSGEVIFAEITTPLSITFVVGIVKWFIDTQGRITSNSTVGVSYVIMFGLITFALLAAFCYGPWAYRNTPLDATSLNKYFLFVEGSLGVLFGLFYNDTFGDRA